jgi:hypothetical protein
MVLAPVSSATAAATQATWEPPVLALRAVRRIPFVLLTALSQTCPEALEVQVVLHRLGLRLTFSLPVDVLTPSSPVPAVPAHYHFADAWETEIIFLARRDPDLYVQYDQDKRDCDTGKPVRVLPTHASRWWDYPDANRQVYQQALHVLELRWKMAWDKLPKEKEESP